MRFLMHGNILMCVKDTLISVLHKSDLIDFGQKEQKGTFTAFLHRTEVTQVIRTEIALYILGVTLLCVVLLKHY